WDIDRLLRAVREIPLRAKEKLTFEYVLLGGVNDQLKHADEVGALLRRVNRPLKVNLIAWNPGPGIKYDMPQPHQVIEFQHQLKLNGVPAYIRKPRGRDIFAACGQLKQTTQVQTGPPIYLPRMSDFAE
ncbi:MAG: 23S rRNA (adenine(2503)-C(2))-methyltransferase RlmN, partial [Acidobacteriaceae bacterium]